MDDSIDEEEYIDENPIYKAHAHRTLIQLQLARDPDYLMQLQNTSMEYFLTHGKISSLRTENSTSSYPYIH